MKNVFSQSQMEQSKLLEEIDVWDHPPWSGIVRNEERNKKLEESSGLSSPTPLQDDSTRDDAEAKNDSWSITWEFIYRHRVEPRVKLYVPRGGSFPIPLKYIDVTRNTHTSLDVLLEKHIEDFWKVDGETELSDAWTGFARFILLDERRPDGYTWSGERLTRKRTTSRPDNVWPDMWKHMSDASKRKSKQKWTIEKLMLDNTRQLRGIFFIEPEHEDCKNIMKNVRRKLEVPMPAAMPCKKPNEWQRWNLSQYWETQDQICLYCWSWRVHENPIGRSSL